MDVTGGSQVVDAKFLFDSLIHNQNLRAKRKSRNGNTNLQDRFGPSELIVPNGKSTQIPLAI